MSRDAGLSLALAAATALAFSRAGAPLVPLTDLQHDEAVHGQLALEWISPPPRSDGEVWPWPWWMKDTYQGSLKSAVLFLSFKAFGASTASLRATTLAAGAASVFFLILFAARRHGPYWGMILAPILATSPGLLLATCYDSGPVALGLLLRSAAIFLVGEALLRPARLGWMLAAGIALGAGVWDKAHFLWLLLAAVPAAGILRARTRENALKTRDAGALLAGVLIGAWPIVYFNLRYPLYTFLYPGTQPGPLLDHLARLPEWTGARLEMAFGALTGSAPYYLSGGRPPAPWAAAAVPLIAVAAFSALARRRRWTDMREPAFWLLLVTGVILIACLTPLPVKWHHFPIVSSLLALAAAAAGRGAFGAAPRGAVRFALGAIALSAALGQLSFLRGFREEAGVRVDGGSGPRGLEGLSRWAQQRQRERAGAAFVSDDALAAPLLVHSGGRVRPAKIRGFARAEEDRLRAKEAFADGRLIFLLRSPLSASSDPSRASRDEILGYVRELPTEALSDFPDEKGRPWVTAYRAAPVARAALDAAWARTAPRADASLSAGAWLERAEAEARTDAPKAALSSLARAEAASPDRNERRRISRLYRDLKEPRRAAAALAALRRLAPRDAALLLELAELRALTGERDAAVELLNRAEAESPEPGVRRRAAVLYRGLKEYRRAAASLEPLLRGAPEDAGLILELAELRAELGESGAALALLTRAEGLREPTPEQRHRVYALHRKLTDAERSIPSLEALCRIFPRDAGLRIDLAELLAKTGRRDASRDSLARAELLDLTADQRRRVHALYSAMGEHARSLAALKPLLRLAPGDASLRLDCAELEARTGANDAALVSLAEAAALRPRGEDRRRVLRLLRLLKAPGRAAAALERMLRDEPADAGLWAAHAEFRSQTGGRSAALESLARAESLNPDDAQRRRIAGLYRELKESSRAASILAELLERDPRDDGLWLERAELEAQTGAKAAALASLDRAERLARPGSDADGERRRRVALVYQSLGEHARAIAVLGELIRRFPAEGAFYGDKGLCEYLSGDAPAAIATLERAIRLKPKFIPAYLTLGAIHAAKGRPGEAVRVYDEGLARVSAGENDPLRGTLLEERAAAARKTAGAR